MGVPLRVLIVEDSSDDAELVLRQLRRAGYDPAFERVQTADAMKGALEREAWDLVVSDYSMPQFDAPAALNLLKQSGRDVPFLVVSGSIGEDVAVAMMKIGAHDYILKQNLTRFVSAVQRELREAENRRQQRLTEQARQQIQIERDRFLERLKQENEDLVALTQVTANAISTLDLDELLRVLLGRVVEVMRADAATILLADGAGLRVRASVGAVDLSNSTDVTQVGEGFAGSVASRMKPVYVEDAAVDPLVADPLIRERGARSMLGVPLKRNGTLIGVLHVDWLTVRPYRDREVHLLEITAERCAAAIQNAQLYQERQSLGDVLEASLNEIFIFDAQTLRFEYINASARRNLGYAMDAMRAMTPLDLKPEFSEAAFHELIAPLRRHEKEKIVFQTTHRRANGDLYPVEVRLQLVERGGKAVFLAVINDITERKHAEAELRLQSAALNAAANIIVITDRDGTVEWVNPAFTALTGYLAGEATGKNLRDLVKSGVHDRAFYKDLWDTILAGQVWHGEMTNRRKDRSLYIVDQTITPVKDGGGVIDHFITIQRDLTEQKRLEAQFLQAQKMEVVGRLASGIAHDFNNLLTIINGTAELALTSMREDDPMRADCLQIHEAGDRAAKLTRQLLAFSRQQILKPEVLNLGTLVADLRGMLQRLIGEDIVLVVAGAKGAGSVMGDPGQIEQVVMNLAVNARDAMANGGTLTIETRDVDLDEADAAVHPSVRPGPHVLLAISDTGEGMDEVTRARIFEPFFTTKELGKGTGLGLSTVYGIVKQSGGSIWVNSELGKGTTFKIYLPRVAEVAHKIRPAPTATSAHGTETVLIVEDEEGVRHLAGLILQLAGYTVLTASNGAEALSRLERHDGFVHLVLTDMVMPGMTVRDLATQLKELHPRTKILYTSGYADDTILPHELFDKATHFISKPYAAAQLRRKVREVLDS